MISTNIFAISVVVTLFHVLSTANTANILCLVDVLTPDQQIWHDAIYKGLADRGHKLTVVSGSGASFKSPAITYIHLEQVEDAVATNKARFFVNTWLSAFERVFHWYERQMKICKAVLSSSGLQELIELSGQSDAKATFDLIIYDAAHGPSCLLALAQLFENVPIVAVSASHITPDLLKVARGAQIQPATVPHFTTVHGEHMNFLERLHNTIVYAMANFFRHFTVVRVQESMLAKSELLQEAHIAPTWSHIIERIQVVLVNTHPAFDYVHALPPNVIEVGGLHFDNLNRPLSVQMQTFIDNSKEGVFIVALGSQGNIEELTPELVTAVMDAVESFPEYGFIWGIDKGAIPSISRKNLFVDRWLKMSSILAQRKVKGLICGGSHMEVQAALYHGLPVIGVTHGSNQPNTAQRAQALGFGLSVNLGTDPKQLQNAMEAIILEGNFTENAKLRQIAFVRRPLNPLDEALWWIEHVLAHPVESGYIISQALTETGFFAMHSFDALSVLLLVLAVFLVNCIVVLRQLKANFSTQTQSVKIAKDKDAKHKTRKTNGHKKKTQ